MVMYNIKGDYSTYYYQGKYYSDYNIICSVCLYSRNIFWTFTATMHKLSTKIRGHGSATVLSRVAHVSNISSGKLSYSFYIYIEILQLGLL